MCDGDDVMSDVQESDDNEQAIQDGSDSVDHVSQNVNSEDNVEHETLNEHKKPRKKGIIYLSTIPPFMNVTKIREILGQYGKLGRVFLQPAVQRNRNGQVKKQKKLKPGTQFTEGWVEFLSKHRAKEVAVLLNNKQIDSHKKSRYYDCIWNLKYLPRFKWIHLNERLAYERAVFKHKMQTEIAQAKREANYFARNVEISEKQKQKAAKQKQKSAQADDSSPVALMSQYKQRRTDEEIKKAKNQPLQPEDRTEILRSLFGQ